MSSYVALHFLKAGLFTTIQDQGRFGYQAFGVPTSGALDQGAAALANRLVGNSLDSPVLEITLMGPKIQFEGEGVMAIAGANLSATLNGVACPNGQAFRVSDNDVLQFGRPVEGCRAYLGVRGKWEIPSWLSSKSAISQNGAALTPASIMQKGTWIKVRNESKKPITQTSEVTPLTNSSPSIRVLPGPEFHRFSRFTIGEFFGQSYRISPDSNRMGYRLQEKLTSFAPNEELISSGIIPGTIQITSAGQPIILLADAQTTGGYYRIANVIGQDLDVLAQLKPGDELRFSLVSFDEKQALA
ncbi:MAG: biotin-dependent carboxyltransferase family protein [Saprospiraceae bacterium]|nr:biotin-dependent carboxyltransferase family protein [Saprospiraceae bacterium]